LYLNRRTLHRAVGAEHAAVTGFRAQQRLAAIAFIEKLAGIYGHGFGFGKTTVRTGQYGLKQDGGRGHGFEV
jgi:hypothetical protein